MTKARRTGIILTGVAGRYWRRAKALLVALPLLMLAVQADYGAAAPHAANRVDSHPSDTAGTEGKAQLPDRGSLAAVDPQRIKSVKLSGDGAGGHEGLAAATGGRLPSRAVARVEPLRARDAAAAHWRIAARPRAPPGMAA